MLTLYRTWTWIVTWIVLPGLKLILASLKPYSKDKEFVSQSTGTSLPLPILQQLYSWIVRAKSPKTIRNIQLWRNKWIYICNLTSRPSYSKRLGEWGVAQYPTKKIIVSRLVAELKLNDITCNIMWQCLHRMSATGAYMIMKKLMRRIHLSKVVVFKSVVVVSDLTRFLKLEMDLDNGQCCFKECE